VVARRCVGADVVNSEQVVEVVIVIADSELASVDWGITK
jgi:hypothetical protein